MVITSVESVPLGYDVDHLAYDFSSGRLTAWNSPLVRLETKNGLVGWGEVNGAFQRAEAVAPLLSRFESTLLGADPADVEEIVARLRRGRLPTRLSESVIGAIEVALFDLLGQRREVPVYALLGGAGTEGRLRAYGSGGLGDTVDRRVEQAVQFEGEGFDVVKLRGMADTDGTFRLVEEALDTLDDQTSIAIDDTGNDGVDDVLGLVSDLNAFADRIAWFEDPAPSRKDLAAYGATRDAAQFPVTGMESCVGEDEFRAALAYDCVDVIHPDVSRSGYGLTRQISAAAAARDVPLVLHVWGGVVTLLANAHYAAADPNCELIEYCRLENELRSEFLPVGFVRDGSNLRLPDTGGLGLTLPDDVADRYPYERGTGHVSFA